MAIAAIEAFGQFRSDFYGGVIYLSFKFQLLHYFMATTATICVLSIPFFGVNSRYLARIARNSYISLAKDHSSAPLPLNISRSSESREKEEFEEEKIIQ